MLRPGSRFPLFLQTEVCHRSQVAAANGSPSAQVDDVRCHQDRGAEGFRELSRRLRVYHF